MRLSSVLFAALLLVAPNGATAQEHDHHAARMAEVRLGELAVAQAWARATLPNQRTAAAYLTIANAGSAPDRLLSASSPAAERVEIHSMAVVDDVMTMRSVPDGLEVPAGGSVALTPGGEFHLMLVNVAEPLAEGGQAPLTLNFERAGALEVMLPVRVSSPDHDHHGQGG
ncbi:MAG TPA: copper chaperone PCu(A)C [Mesorhizobium sp.]|jgi:hypothetical protein|nr:copper chaperone PCu(A)C [Mesorhizobium sp.]